MTSRQMNDRAHQMIQIGVMLILFAIALALVTSIAGPADGTVVLNVR